MRRFGRPMIGRSLAFVVSVGWLLASARTVDAQRNGRAVATADDEARALYDAGVMAYGNGRFGEALERFQRAYELSHRPALLFNVASCQDRLRQDARAVESYRAYLEAQPDAENRGFVEERIRFLEGTTSASRAPTASPEPVATPGATVPTPAVAASQAGVVAVPADGTDATTPRDTHDRPLYKKWWLWTIVGTVVVAAVAVPIAVTRSGNEPPPLETGSTGSVVFTLGAR